MDSFTIPSKNNQDYAGTGRIGNIDYIFLFDGHGTNNVIRQIREMDMDEIATSSDPVQAVHQRLVGNTYGSGSTMAFARITDTHVETFNCGDSSIRVLLNGTTVHQSTPHTFLDTKEVQRTQHTVARIQPCRTPFPVSSTRVEDILSPVGHFSCGESLVPSQSLGHNNMTGLSPERFTLHIQHTDILRMVVSSDGFSDMLVDESTGTAKELAEEAHRRWFQKWDYMYKGTLVQTDFGGDVDDIGIAIYDNTIKTRPILCIPWSPTYFEIDDVFKTFEFLFTGVSHVDEVIRNDYKMFFIHFIPGKLQKWESSFKVYYGDDWYWTTRIYDKSPPPRCVDDLYRRWDRTIDWKSFIEHEIPESICRKMKPIGM